MPTARSPRPRAMTGSRLALARTAAYRGLAASIGLTIAVSVAVLCGLSGWVSLDTRTALRAAFADEADSYAQVQTRVADDPAAQDAAADALFGRLFGDAATIDRRIIGEEGADTARVAWRITPDASTLDAGRLVRLSRGVEALPDAFRASDAAVQGSEDSGDLGEALAAARTGVAAAAAIAPVPLSLVAVLAWFAVLELSRLLGAARGREAVLLRARGLSRRQSVALTLGESGAVGLAAAAVGFGAAIGLLALRDGTAGAEAALNAWPLALVAALTAVLTLGLQSDRAAQAAGAVGAGAGRVARAATGGAAVLLLLAAVVFAGQALSTRDLAPDDPWRITVLALAPTLGVAAVAVLSVLLFAPASTALSTAAGARPGVSPAYPARQVARRVVAFSTAIALIAIAVAGATLAAGYIGTWRAASDSAARLSAGAELRAQPGGAVTPEGLAPALAVDGVAVAAPALTADLVVGDGGASLVAVPSGALGEVLLEVPGVFDPEAAASALSWDPTSAALPDGSTGIGLSARVTSSFPGAAETLQVGAWVADATGTPARLPLEVSVVDDEGAGFALTADGGLPLGTAPWRLLSVDVTRSGAFQGVAVTVSEAVLVAVEGTGEVRLDVEPEPSVLLQGFGAEAVSGAVIWSGAGLAPPPTPAVISQALATERGTEVGDPLDARFDGTGRTAALTVAAIVPAIAGASSNLAVLVALDTLSQNFLDATPQPGPAPSLVPPDQVWAAGDPAAAAALGDALGTSVQTPTDGAAAITSSLIPAWWASAVGGAVLAGVALIALLAALAAQRAGEVLVLRALGIPPARQARLRVVEASVVAALAAALGLIGGLLLAMLLVPVMADTAVPGSAVSGAGGLVVEPWVLVAALAVLALALAIAAVLAASAIARQGSSTRLEEAAA